MILILNLRELCLGMISNKNIEKHGWKMEIGLVLYIVEQQVLHHI